MTIEDITHFGKLLELLGNRCDVINQMLGYTRKGDKSAPMRMRMVRGRYVVELDHCEITSFGVYDIDETERAIDVVNGMNDGIWVALRQGLLMVA